ncbi:MAG: 1-deoxy-D-xylulose-5-phosphate synthase [Candidatus Omnitrophica bacterium]|nr:1-deoxy-D-xylulose-5-phosphate synthase [Candidatus Omnitrophota bacterium]
MLLEKINSPADLKKLPLSKLPALAQEIRQRIVEVVSLSGGHIASSLGAVELIIALHYCLNAPQDKIIFDVGHQAYAHKILTGRNKSFSTLRQFGGISGFPSKDESEYDPFTTGHSSNSVSLAMGLVCARDYNLEQYRVAAVIGDGSLSGGPCFEGLNNAGHLKKDVLIVLNTNELSIAPNVGAISTYLNKLISLPVYNRFKASLENFAEQRLPRGSRLVKLANKFEEGLKGLFVPGMLFEELGFRYFGPFDGHDVELLINRLKNILTIRGPLLVHVITKKGKGYLPSEKEPVRFHGTSAFEIETGDVVGAKKAKTYTDIFSQEITNLGAKIKELVAVTAAMSEGTGLDKFRDAYPKRFFDVGIAEAHAVSFAAGLARSGLIPVVAVYSTFLQRAYDQIVEDVCLQNLGVVFAVDRAGIVGEDGVTHQGIFDLAFLRHIPNLVLMAPKDADEFRTMLGFALTLKKPVAIRYPKAVCPQSGWQVSEVELGKPELLKEGKDFAIVALGSMVDPAVQAITNLEKSGLKGTLINARFVRPLDKLVLQKLVGNHKYIFTIEDGVLDGGFGSAVEEVLDKLVIRLGLPSEFVVHGKRDMLLEKYGLTANGIANKIKEVVH